MLRLLRSSVLDIFCRTYVDEFCLSFVTLSSNRERRDVPLVKIHMQEAGVVLVGGGRERTNIVCLAASPIAWDYAYFERCRVGCAGKVPERKGFAPLFYIWCRSVMSSTHTRF